MAAMRLRIVADEREKASGVPGMLTSMGLRVDFAQLSVGDYVLSEGSALERKTVRDLVTSVYDGRLFKQCSDLASHYLKSFLLIEGRLEELPEFSENPRAIYGALASIAAGSTVKFLCTASREDTANLIALLVKHLRETGLRAASARTPKKRSLSMQDDQLYIVTSLPGIGEKLGRRLLRAFGSPRSVFLARASELARVPGLGRARASRIAKILEKPFREIEEAGTQARLD